MRCAAFHLALDADPIGTAGAHDGFLCVEVPLPWGRDISEHEPFVSLLHGASLTGADGRSWRAQGLVPRGDTAGAVRVLALDQPARPAATPYRRREWWVAPDQVGALCEAVLQGGHEALAGFEAQQVLVADDVVDLLVCTHGRRDVCCGGDGTRLYEQLAAALADGAPGDGPPVRLWRTSHTGGHKFAPTAISFPDGYAWAHLDLPAALALVRRDGPVTAVLAHCRGLSSLPPAAQVADRELLGRVGWRWANATRRAAVAEPGGPTHRSEVRLDAVVDDAQQLSVMVQVESARSILQPTCGDAHDAEAPLVPVWQVARVDPLPPAQ